MKPSLKLLKNKHFQDSHLLIPNALQFLYEEALRNESPVLASVLNEIISFCDAIERGDKPSKVPKNSLEILFFLKGFLEMSSEKQKNLLRILSSES